MTEDAWYKSWFDTEYYHILYQHRDDNEAQFFIKNLINKLDLPYDTHILDLACGRGRHAKFLSELGYEVTGIDLSESNIEFARQFETSRLHFEVGDMREPFGDDRFDSIFNLFTSFGYFDNREDNLRALHMMKRSLKPEGTLVMDFMNVHKVVMGLVEEEIRVAAGIEFHLQRIIRNGSVLKLISFTDGGHRYNYEERVQLLEKQDFEELFAQAGLRITATYGDFDLRSYDPDQSERLILVAHHS